MIDDGTGLLTIGELARSTGLTVRTIRYWSDEGVLTPVTRSAGGYRLYDAESAARLELIRTLRELGLGLDDVRKVLAGETTIAEVAAAHVVALDAQIRALRVTRAVLSTVARRGSTAEEMTFMNKLARLSAAERRRIMGEFVEELFHGLDTVDPCIKERMRSLAGIFRTTRRLNRSTPGWSWRRWCRTRSSGRRCARPSSSTPRTRSAPPYGGGPPGSPCGWCSWARRPGSGGRPRVAGGRGDPAGGARRGRRPGRRTRTDGIRVQRPARPLPGVAGHGEGWWARGGAPGGVRVGGRRTARSPGRLI